MLNEECTRANQSMFLATESTNPNRALTFQRLDSIEPDSIFVNLRFALNAVGSPSLDTRSSDRWASKADRIRFSQENPGLRISGGLLCSVFGPESSGNSSSSSSLAFHAQR